MMADGADATKHLNVAVQELHLGQPMRPPYRREDENHGNHGESATTAPRRDPSFVDRRRLDSDVRAFLRQPSTPWVVFDRDSRVPRDVPRDVPIGAFTSARSSLASTPGFFPQTSPS